MSFNRFSNDGEELDNRVSQRAGGETQEGAQPDPGVGQDMERVLRDFRLSVHAWSDAVYQGPRQVEVAPRRMAWRTATAWALGSVLVVGSAGGGLVEYQYQKQQARIAAAREAEHQREIQEQRAREAEEELAKVDNEVSREVPNALEPLAQLMTSDESQ
jgi:hypothetical protein